MTTPADRPVRIVVFACRYCAYGAADLAGAMHLAYPPAVRLVEMPCTGRLDHLFLLDAFLEGADGVLVAGCLEGDCHFLVGNYRAKRRVQATRTLLTESGLDPERLEMINLSSAMASEFARQMQRFTEKIQALGPRRVPAEKGRDA